MQEDENQPEEEQQPLSEKEAEEKQPEQEQQLVSGDAADESQSHASGSQPPPAAPTPLPLTVRQKRRQYLLGLGFGSIPLFLFLASGVIFRGGGNFSVLFTLGVILYIVELIATIACLSTREVRPVGYGLLTAFLATPVIGGIGCLVIISSSL